MPGDDPKPLPVKVTAVPDALCGVQAVALFPSRKIIAQFRLTRFPGVPPWVIYAITSYGSASQCQVLCDDSISDKLSGCPVFRFLMRVDPGLNGARSGAGQPNDAITLSGYWIRGAWSRLATLQHPREGGEEWRLRGPRSF
jgi:hypothetical protein